MGNGNQLLGELMAIEGCADFWTYECQPTYWHMVILLDINTNLLNRTCHILPLSLPSHQTPHPVGLLGS